MNSLPVYCFGISCKTADEQLRGRLVVPASAVPDLIGYFIRETGISGAVVISTCNRTEVYFSDVAADTESCSARENARIQNVFSRLDAILCDFAGADIHQMRRYLRYYSGISAVEHLLKVTTSLDSLNIGENEVCAYFDDYDEPVKTTVVLYDENGSSKDQSATGDSSKDSSTKDSSTKDSANSPKTGDASHMYLWLIITLASLAGGAGVLYTAKRKGIFTK